MRDDCVLRVSEAIRPELLGGWRPHWIGSTHIVTALMASR